MMISRKRSRSNASTIAVFGERDFTVIRATSNTKRLCPGLSLSPAMRNIRQDTVVEKLGAHCVSTKTRGTIRITIHGPHEPLIEKNRFMNSVRRFVVTPEKALEPEGPYSTLNTSPRAMLPMEINNTFESGSRFHFHDADTLDSRDIDLETSIASINFDPELKMFDPPGEFIGLQATSFPMLHDATSSDRHAGLTDGPDFCRFGPHEHLLASMINQMNIEEPIDLSECKDMLSPRAIPNCAPQFVHCLLDLVNEPDSREAIKIASDMPFSAQDYMCELTEETFVSHDDFSEWLNTKPWHDNSRFEDTVADIY